MFIACDSFWLRVAPVTVVSVASLSQDGRVGEAVKDEVQDWCKGEKKTEVLFFLLSASWKREREKSFASFRTMWPRHGYGHQRGRPRFCNDADGHAATEKKWVMKDPPSENVKRKMKIERDEKYRLGSAVDRHLGQDLPLFRQLIYDAISRVF